MQPRLVLSKETGAFSWIGPAAQRSEPEAAGLTRSTKAHSSGGLLYYTADYSGKPVSNPYAVAHFAPIATPEAQARLAEITAEIEASRSLGSNFEVPVPDGQELMPFQRSGIEYASRRRHALIGDDMGLGKTVQGLGFCNLVKAKRVLVLCPAAVRLQWRVMAHRWMLGKPLVHILASGKHGVHPHARLVVCSYDTARNPAVAAALASQSWDVVLLDECHYLKNHDAQRTVAILGGYRDGSPEGVLVNAGHVIGLTGTPLPNRPRECYTITRALCWDTIEYQSEEQFRFRYNSSTMLGNGHNLEQVGRLPELQNRLRANFMVRRLKSEVLTQLPAKSYEIVQVDSAGTRKVVAAERILEIPDNAWQDADALFGGNLAQLRKEMGIAKAPLAADYLRVLLSGGDKVFAVAHHLEVLRALKEELAEFEPVGVSGATSTAGRMAAVKRFQDDPKCSLFLGQIKAVGTGVDGLQQVCSRVVFIEPSWTPGENEQCADRLHRHGQVDAVQVDFLVAPGSLDERVLSRVVEKLRHTDAALDKRF